MLGTVGAEVERARTALVAAQPLLRRDDLVPRRGPLEPADALAMLSTAEAAIHHDLCSGSVPADRRPHLAVALLHLGGVRVALSEAQAAARSAANRMLSALLDGLRLATTVPQLVETVPRELADLGYDRVMVSQVRQGKWFPLSTYVRDNPGQATQMIVSASRAARPVDPRVAEYDMVANGQPILIPDTRHDGRVHPELLALTGVRSYAAAPIVVDSAVAGFVHADCHESGRTIEPSDATLLAAVGEVLAFALEKAHLSRRLQRITDLLQEPDEEFAFRIEQARVAGPGHESPASAVTASPARLSQLSPRELEVLRHVAEGANNAAIAMRLGLAETTVKTHIKHIIRKLGVTNRAAAVGLYLHPLPGSRS